jgi:bifunctional DNase/RNase
MADPLIEMVVESVRVHMLSSQHVVILKETERDRYLPIWIGPWEANAIAMKLQGLAPERPLTHDLFSATLDELGVAVRRVVISDLAEDTFHARLFLTAGERTVEIDSRPSDALALAVRAGARIYAEPAVLERAGVSPEPDEDDETRDTEGSLLERPPSRTAAERAADPRLDIFRDFVNSLGSDQESEGTGSE